MPTGLLDAANTALIPPSAEPVATYTPTIAQAKEASSTSYTPNATVVDDKDTVQGQLKTILDSDSVLMQQARTRAAQEANARGLLSSSLAVGDAQAKMAERALPIAQQDAGTYFTANQKTIDAQNAALNFGAAAQNQASLANAQLGTDVNKANAGLINEAGKSAADAANTQMLARLDAQTRLSVAQLDAQTKEKLAILDAQNRQLLQTNANAANYFNNTVNAISAIAQNQTMSPEAKNAATQTQLNLLNEALQASAAIGGTAPANVASLDLSQYFGGGTAGEAVGTAGGAGDFAGTQAPTRENMDWQRYLRENPGVAQAQQIGSPTYYPPAAGMSPQDWAWFHYSVYGQNDGNPAYSR